MRKLNFGCGTRYAPGWDNIDFYSSGPEVHRVNLLQGLPYPPRSFDVVYSSHVLEHFTKTQCLFMLRECFRVLKPDGYVRVVVPDIGLTIDEYLRIRDLPDEDVTKADKYRWIMIELLDQLVRTERHGEWGKMLTEIRAASPDTLADYVRHRLLIREDSALDAPKTTTAEKLKGIHKKIASRWIYWWLRAVRLLVPQSVRSSVFNNTSIGEKHLWMYDKYGMTVMLREAGFVNIKQKKCNESDVSGLIADLLDTNSDGSPYKALSLYMEAQRPSD